MNRCYLCSELTQESTTSYALDAFTTESMADSTTVNPMSLTTLDGLDAARTDSSFPTTTNSSDRDEWAISTTDSAIEKEYAISTTEAADATDSSTRADGMDFTTETVEADSTTVQSSDVPSSTPIVFADGPEATTYLAEANLNTESGLTTESFLLDTTTAESETMTTEYPDFTQVKIPPRRNNSRLKYRRNYYGYRVFRVILASEEAVKRILQLENESGVEFWADPHLLLRPRGIFVTSAADIMASPRAIPVVEEAFREARAPYSVLIDNVQVNSSQLELTF